MHKYFNETLDILESIPVAGILSDIFTGKWGFIAPIAVLAQIGVQILAGHNLHLSGFGTFVTDGVLIVIGLAGALVVAMIPLSGMTPQPLYKSEGYLMAAAIYALAISGIAGIAVIGFASLVSGAGFGAFLTALLISSLGGTIVNVVGFGLPVYYLHKK